MKKKIGSKNVGGGQNNRFNPIEDALHLATMFCIASHGLNVGSCILMKGDKADRLCFVFGFECGGIHSTLRSEQLNTIFNNLEVGLKDLPANEQITFHSSSFANDELRQEELKGAIAKAPSIDSQYLLTAEKARIQELTRKGVRKPKSLRIYVTYTIEPDTAQAQDWMEKILAKGLSFWQEFTGEAEERDRIQIQTLLTQAYKDGFGRWQQILSNKMGLEIKPLTAEKLWAVIWQRFNISKPKPIPQMLVLDEEGVREEVQTDLHSTTLLLESEVPVCDRQWVKVKDKYVGVMTFLEKPGGWSNKLAQLRYLWEVMARESVTDTEIFCQLTPANPALVKTTMQRVLKQSNLAASLAQEKNKTIDVGAQLKVKKTVAAQEQLLEGAIPIYAGVVILIHRPNLEQLDTACRYMENCFQQPAWVIRETEYAWKLWLQTLPIVWERLLATPFDRRQCYLTSEVPGLIPLVTTKPADPQGFELITDEGGTPVHINLFEGEAKHLGLFATTRGGKSVLVSGILTQALARGIPVVALDYPKPDGTSTFTDYTHFMEENGAYFDISKESNNLFEKPNLQGLDLETQKDRLRDYEAFLELALTTMVLGSNSENVLLSQNVRSIISLALNAFFTDGEIQQRYEAAIAGGFGSSAWQETPTLKDFLNFCTPENLNLSYIGGKIDEAFQQIQLRLRFWVQSRVGKAISEPSSFPTDAKLLVFALRNLSDDEDAAILSLSAYSAALRRALSNPASIFFIDEAPILFEFDQVADVVSRLCANGNKSGVRVILSAQDPDTIAKSKVASKIFQNLKIRLIGRIQAVAINSFEDILKYPKEIIEKNAGESFFPKKEDIYSQWLLDYEGRYTFCRYYPAYEQLAVVANNPDEQKERTTVMQQYTNKYEGLSAFARRLVAKLRGS
ncbi:hypothetical protein ACE1CI_05180 [Aerosakkonemataceae cyanobacterium BLCC-F50]|uniref:Helicase HerA central domain-containing protein n=1 Tax=Floridaenema flaviceps BLCC-F50 TaxID=3153642 RepID=A0ABV4XKV1_9CYAN